MIALMENKKYTFKKICYICNWKEIQSMVEVRNIQDFNDYLDTLLNQTECDDIEFKSAAGGFPSSFWETYSAFANTDGGTIVFGVKETDGKFSLNGLSEEQIEKYKKDFWNNVNNRSTISCNLMNENNVLDAEYKGYKFLIFFIPRASKEQRPVFKATDPYNGTYKRNYEGDYKCSRREINRMYARQPHLKKLYDGGYRHRDYPSVSTEI